MAIQNTKSINTMPVDEKNSFFHLWLPRQRWQNNIKMYLKETGCDVEHCIQLAQDKVQW